jgi:hypothetical protein
LTTPYTSPQWGAGGRITAAQEEDSMRPSTLEVFERLERLEKQNRRIKLAATLLLIFASSLILMSATWHKEHTVEARQIVLKDDEGNTRAVLGMRSAGPGLTLYGADGERVQALLSVLQTGPVLGLYDADGTTRVLLGVTPKGATVTFNDAEGKLRAEMGFSGDAPHVTFFDRDGNPVYVGH